MPLIQSDAIEVKRIAGKGRGVFARRVIRRGEVIERAPVLVLSMSDLTHDVEGQSRRGVLADYCFLWGRGTVALTLGFGSLYNHSYRPNAVYHDAAPRTKVFTALRDIAPGEEITINYNGDPDDGESVGFPIR